MRIGSRRLNAFGSFLFFIGVERILGNIVYYSI